MRVQGHADWRRLVYANVIPWNLSTPIEPESRAEQTEQREGTGDDITPIMMNKWTDHN